MKRDKRGFTQKKSQNLGVEILDESIVGNRSPVTIAQVVHNGFGIIRVVVIAVLIKQIKRCIWQILGIEHKVRTALM
jgi:hypothetical protein